MYRYKDLEIWKRSRAFCSSIYSTTNKFPTDEKFGITNQLRRASISIPSNIAEGSSRNSNKDFSRFLTIAIGSAYEIETQLIISNDLKFLDKTILNELLIELSIIIKMIVKFKSSLN